MNQEHFAIFLEIQKITNPQLIWEELQTKGLFFSYFQVDNRYYFFGYGANENFLDLEVIYQRMTVIQELDTKQRKIRSLRGFILYALEIMKTGQDFAILATNCNPFFWRKVKNIIRQNKKGALTDFLFATSKSKIVDPDSIQQTTRLKALEEKVEALKKETILLQQKISYLENNYRVERNSNNDLEAPRKPVNAFSKDFVGKPLETVETSVFVPLNQLSEDEKRDIIKMGFQLHNDGRITLKDYYQGTEELSLFQLRGYKLKYESIRRTKLYSELKLNY